MHFKLLITVNKSYLAVCFICFIVFHLNLYSLYQSRGGHLRPRRINYFPGLSSDGKRDVYATILGANLFGVDIDTEDPWAPDIYFNATRLVVYQLLHDPRTRDERDVVVMHTRRVADWKLDQLRRDGAVLRYVDDIATYPGGQERYSDVMTKLRVWELTEFRRILFVDADMVLTASLAPLWEHDCATEPLELAEPGSYSITGQELEMEGDFIETKGGGEHHVFAAAWDRFRHRQYFNSGFFLLTPSKKMFDRLLRYAPHPELWRGLGTEAPEQNLLNNVFRADGPTPWSTFPLQSTVFAPDDDLFARGALAIHTKFWINDGKLGAFGWRAFGRMERFYAQRYGYDWDDFIAG